MKKRYDVMRLAATMDIASGIDIETIYCFLMKVFGRLGIYPKRLEWTVGDGIIFPVGMRDRLYFDCMIDASDFIERYMSGAKQI